MGEKREFTWEFKLAAVKRLAGGESGSKLQGELGVKRSILYRWAEAYRKSGEGGLARKAGRPRKTPAAPVGCPEPGELSVSSQGQLTALVSQQAQRIAELERLVGQQTLDIDFFAKAFKRVNELRANASGATASTGRSGK